MSDINTKLTKWTHKEYDIIPKQEESETGLISGSQTLEKFPGSYNFSLTPIGNDILILGNINQSYPILYRLDLSTLELKEEIKHSDLSKFISNIFIHTAFTCNDRLYIFHNICPQNPNCLTIYDPESLQFYPIKGDTHASSFRINYTVNEYKGLAYIFGGLNEKCEPLNTVEIFDLATYRWRASAAHGKLPSPRHSHVSCLIKGILYIYGGTSEISFNDPTPLIDLYAFDLSSLIWTKIIPKGQIPKGNSISLGSLNDSTLLLFWSDNGEIKTSIYSIPENEWKELIIEGGKPTRRYGSTGILAKNKGILLGGFSENEYKDVVYCNILDIKRHTGKK